MKKIIGALLICILLVSTFFAGKSLGAAKPPAPVAETAIPEETAQRNLRISLTPDRNAGFAVIPLEQGNYRDVTCLNVRDVTINMDGTAMKLEDALLNGSVSVDELVAWARQDASQGLCQEVRTSKNGLAEFTYCYRDFRLHHVYDLYETPDGRKHFITDFLIYGAGAEPQFRPTDEETMEIIDYEDWGLNFEISKLDSSKITVNVSQAGGQQMGELSVVGTMLFRIDPNTRDIEIVQPVTNEEDSLPFISYEDWNPAPDDFLTMGGATKLSFDLARRYGELPSGDYRIDLQIADWYDKESVHPLMQNFYDVQWYGIEFTVG